MSLQLSEAQERFVADFKVLLEKHEAEFSCLEVAGESGDYIERVSVEFLGVGLSAEDVYEALTGKQFGR